MNNPLNNYEHYGDDLYDAARMSEYSFETQTRGINPVWFLPIVLLGGLLTTVFVFVMDYVITIYVGQNFFANFISRNFLIWLINFIIPLGSVLGGFFAGLGYAVTAHYVQFYPKKHFIFFIFFLQLTTLFVAKYLEYTIYCYEFRLRMPLQVKQLRQNLNDTKTKDIKVPSFIEFYRTTVEESEWQERGNPCKLGKWAWIHEFSTVIVFALSSLICSGTLTKSAYCQTCRRFMLQKLEFTFPMRTPRRKIKKEDKTALEIFRQEERDAMNYATEKFYKIENFLKTEQATNRLKFFKLLSKIRDEIIADAKTTKNVPNEIRVIYFECDSCDNFSIKVSIILHGNNDEEDNDNNDKKDNDNNEENNETIFSATDLIHFTDGKFVTSNEIPTLTI
jgi:hypothetical protein